ncbi:MAG TPA: four-helix bundle copper-binding protein [Polyangiaceae bacterium]|nr:four-helix bundle copper-binding protein [Polyangiaceae bacterium]
MQQTVSEMLRAFPKTPIGGDDLAACIDACFDCAQTCIACADACLAEDRVSTLTRCIRLNLDCASICETTGQLLTRQYQPDLELLRRTIDLCRLACETCAVECERHAAMHEHCRICGEACRGCEQACQKLLAAFDAARAAPH